MKRLKLQNKCTNQIENLLSKVWDKSAARKLEKENLKRTTKQEVRKITKYVSRSRQIP